MFETLICKERFKQFSALSCCSVVVVLLSACSGTATKPTAQPTEVDLLSGLGKHHYPITIAKPEAQPYFDQGMVLAYGFNHSEAVKSFQVAYTINPAVRCAIGAKPKLANAGKGPRGGSCPTTIPASLGGCGHPT